MWQVVQRAVRQPVVNVVKHTSAYEKPPPDLGTRIYKHLKKNFEVLPIVGIVATVSCWASYHIYHALTSKGDVRFAVNGHAAIFVHLSKAQEGANKCKRMKAPHEEIGPTQKTKMLTLHPENYIPIQELEAVRNDLAKDDVPKKPC